MEDEGESRNMNKRKHDRMGDYKHNIDKLRCKRKMLSVEYVLCRHYGLGRHRREGRGAPSMKVMARGSY